MLFFLLFLQYNISIIEEGYDEKDILRKVKAEIANLVTNYEDVENVNDYFVFSLTTFGQILTNEKEMLENLTVTKVKKLTQNINSYPYSIVTLTPKKKSCQASFKML